MNIVDIYYINSFNAMDVFTELVTAYGYSYTSGLNSNQKYQTNEFEFIICLIHCVFKCMNFE